MSGAPDSLRVRDSLLSFLYMLVFFLASHALLATTVVEALHKTPHPTQQNKVGRPLKVGLPPQLSAAEGGGQLSPPGGSRTPA